MSDFLYSEESVMFKTSCMQAHGGLSRAGKQSRKHPKWRVRKNGRPFRVNEQGQRQYGKKK